MKISTYRKVLIAVQIIMLIVMFNEDRWLPLFFPSDVPAIITVSPLAFWCAVLFVPMVLLILDRFFRFNSHKKTTKLGNVFFTGVIVFAIGLPLIFIPARTQITSKAITKHNIFGNVSRVYEFSEASEVKADLYMWAGMRSITVKSGFSYAVTFEDGYEEVFTDSDLDENWYIIEKIDRTIESNSIKKEVYGKGNLEHIYEYGGVGYVGDKVRMLME